MPSGVCTVAPTGQTCSHPAFSQCWQAIGWKCARGAVQIAFEVRIDANPLHVAPDLHLLAPDMTAMLFSA